MAIYEFKCWCEKAVSGIIFPPDQRKVFRELMEHMEDHYDILREEGYCEDIAIAMTVEAMGDPYPIARDLAQIHRPFWGYVLQATQVILVIALVITLIPFIRHAWKSDYTPPMSTDWAVFREDAYGEGTGRILRHLSEPNISRKTDGYTYTLTNALCWHNEEYGNNVFIVYLKEFHPLPWAEHGEAGDWFWAEDSTGTVYECYYEHRPYEETPVLYSRGNDTSPFSHTYALWLSGDLPDEAEWVDIRYTRDGRNLVFRVNLNGGDGA